MPGTVGTSPFGSNVRSIVIKVDLERLRAYNLSPNDVVQALSTGNLVAPAGNLYIKDEMPMAPFDAMIKQVEDFGKIPLRKGQNVYIRDVATIRDATDINYGFALVDGKPSVYIPVVKQNTSSTLTVVSDIRASMSAFQNVLPPSVKISYEFDESPTVVEAIKSVAIEGFIGATLTGLMILLFLHDWRSVIVVVFNIPMALLSSLLALWMTGATINIMTLGGLALSIGMLVDEATVSIENIHVQMERTKSLARAVLRGSNETAVPRLLAMLCILSVFIPAFIMAEPVRSLFVPLSLAVGFAMIASYLLSSTVVPVLSVWLLKHRGDHGPPEPGQPSESGSGQRSESGHQDAKHEAEHGAAEQTGARRKASSKSGEKKPGLFDRLQEKFGHVVSWMVDCALARCAGLFGGVLRSAGPGRFGVGDRIVSAGRLRRIRDPISHAAGNELRADQGGLGALLAGHR